MSGFGPHNVQVLINCGGWMIILVALWVVIRCGDDNDMTGA